jgi:hypothetical protein
VKLFVKNPNVIGNATNLNAPNLNVNLFVKILLVDLNLNVVNVMLMDFLSPLCLCSKKKNKIPHVVNVMITNLNYQFLELFKYIFFIKKYFNS